jgi:formylglycine-generating enzyme required for sulfatase activity
MQTPCPRHRQARKRIPLKTACPALLLLVATAASAWVRVGDVGNPPSLDLPIRCCNHRCTPGEGAGCPDTGFGSVDHVFEIQQGNVSFLDYLSFLEAVADADPNGLCAGTMENWIARTGDSGSYVYALIDPAFATLPVVNVSWFSMLRYANWLHNGRPSGPQGPATTEDGAYTLLGSDPPDVLRNPDARYFLPTEDEWYKAAYYDPTEQSYSRFSWGDTPANGRPVSEAVAAEDTNLCPAPGSPSASCRCPVSEGPNELTPICAYPGRSAFGLCDATGNASDVLETREISSGGTGAPPAGTVMTVLKGGAYVTPGFCDAAADGRNFARIDSPGCSVCAFRLARQPVPEPAGAVLAVVALASVAGIARLRDGRRANRPDIAPSGRIRLLHSQPPSRGASARP